MSEEGILDSDFLLRRIPLNNPHFIKPDGSIASNAFKLNKASALDGLSVDLLRISDYDISIYDPSRYLLVKIPVSILTNFDLECVHSPTSDNNAHCLIKGNITKGASKAMAGAAVIHEKADE